MLLQHGGLPAAADVDADNLTLTGSAGTTVAEARAAADARQGRMLPLDPGHPARATIGGVVATGDQGARGAGYGGVRDVVLGLRATLADGSAVKFGGRTMKNVTGYDMTKLFVGSFGVLGVITEVTFRLLPRNDSAGAGRPAACARSKRPRPIAARVLASLSAAPGARGGVGRRPAGRTCERAPPSSRRAAP